MRDRERSHESSLNFKLLTFLGSPFVNDDAAKKINFSDDEKLELYKIAFKNKIGLFFLERLKEIGQLSPLEDKYASDRERYNETLITAVDLSRSISESTSDFAIFKFLKPYPHTPSDVDALFFLSKKHYSETVQYLLNNGYFKIGESPSQVVVYDLRGGYEQMDRRTVDGKKGGKYYIDLYNAVSASHFIYMDASKLHPYIVSVNIDDKEIQTLLPEADLAVVLTHSIVPEQLFTLADYYMALNTIKQLNDQQLDDLINIFEENNVIAAARAALTIIGYIHKRVNGFIPEKVDYLINQIGLDKKNHNEMVTSEFIFPHRYDAYTILKVMIGRMRNRNGLKSIFVQGICMIFNPWLMRSVIRDIIKRRKRETY